MRNNITDIHCPSCGAPAAFDIVRQQYTCSYCGGTIETRDVSKLKKGFRKIQQERIRNSSPQYRLQNAICSGCGAEIIFQENEAVSNCAFCGRSLVRKKFAMGKRLPENVIPFTITEGEAKQALYTWCMQNKSKREAKHLEPLISELKGFYLPYELVRGPVHMRVSRMDRGKTYACESFMNQEFINRSSQLDNLLLDGMEPFDLEGLTEFDFAYVAGLGVKTSDISGDELIKRTKEEVANTCLPAVRKVLETKAIQVLANVDDALSIPVLLPVYYICRDGVMAAVNGQTGKVSVRAEKESHYFFAPWWVKSIFYTLLGGGLCYLAFLLFGMDRMEGLMFSGALTFFFLIVTLCLFSDTTKNKFSVEAGRKIFTSGDHTLRREGASLVVSEKILERRISDPVFLWNINGKVWPARLKFTTPYRVVRMILLCMLVLFLPVVLALLINGFQFSQLRLAGSAIWFCIAVPTVPIYLLKFGIVQLYEKPWVYVQNQVGKWVRYKQPSFSLLKHTTLRDVLKLLFVPPASLGVWFGLITFAATVYFTAGYGW